jgi:hypothetical protein
LTQILGKRTISGWKLSNIKQRVVPAITVLPYDIGIERVFGSIRAHIEDTGRILPDAGIHIAATAIGHNLKKELGAILGSKWLGGNCYHTGKMKSGGLTIPA